MWVNNRIIQEDLDYISTCSFISWDKLKNKTIFITGTTGIIGQNIVNSLLYASNKLNLNIKVIGLVRDLDKAKELFLAQLRDVKGLEFVKGDVRTFNYPSCSIDYIIHGASITSSKKMVEDPNEVIDVSVEGTNHIINLAREKKVKTLLYLSSMEVYGQSEKGKLITENDTWTFDKSNPRDSYPLSKQICENNCLEYSKENISLVKINRLAQTIGPGLSENDEKIFSYFARCLLNKEDIVLRTKGESERCYNYTIDTVAGIITTLLDESKENIYNVANNNTYSSIKDVANTIAKDKVNVIFDTTNNNQYPNDSYLLLDESKLQSLGFKHKYNNFFDRYMEFLKIKNNPLISIVVPVYNVEKYLDRCVNSLINQTYKNIEILLVDDGSTDNSGAMCDKYASSHDFIKVIHKTNGGLSDARNFGIKEAKGEYISFVDSDDYVSNDYIEHMFETASKYSADVVATKLYDFYGDEDTSKDESSVNYKVFSNIEAIKTMFLGSVFGVSSCAKLFKKNLFDNISFPLGYLYEDQLTLDKVLEKCTAVVYSSKKLYHYYQNSNGIMHGKCSERNIKSINKFKEIIDALNTKYPSLYASSIVRHLITIIANMNNILLRNEYESCSEMYNLLSNEVKKCISWDILSSNEIRFKFKIKMILYSINNTVSRKLIITYVKKHIVSY